MNTGILVILYGKGLHDSKTISKLLDTTIDECCYLHIVNNGPEEILISNNNVLESLKIKFKNVLVEQFLENRPLSFLYNSFLNNDYDRFIFFDDDSDIPLYFFRNSLNVFKSEVGIDIQLPIIKSIVSNKYFYPVVNDVVIKKSGFTESNDEVFSIGSGIIIYSSLINKFREFNLTLFDNRFALYGVDFSLFRRIHFLKKKGINVGVYITQELKHSLSRESGSISKWREKERLIDYTLTSLFYSKSYILKISRISKIFFMLLLRKDTELLKEILKVIVNKKHPMC
ncbi:hypothetical protein [Rosenbergiella epipactidis]|uniref:hypothetical protein n=1 Tax=Rosenbergiella epipactidis TaxID=1544694 RepID=UPI001F4E7EF9|nr:hypothetical protein [Rosenbergiella epipactidis]